MWNLTTTVLFLKGGIAARASRKYESQDDYTTQKYSKPEDFPMEPVSAAMSCHNYHDCANGHQQMTRDGRSLSFDLNKNIAERWTEEITARNGRPYNYNGRSRSLSQELGDPESIFENFALPEVIEENEEYLDDGHAYCDSSVRISSPQCSTQRDERRLEWKRLCVSTKESFESLLRSVNARMSEFPEVAVLLKEYQSCNSEIAKALNETPTKSENEAYFETIDILTKINTLQTFTMKIKETRQAISDREMVMEAESRRAKENRSRNHRGMARPSNHDIDKKLERCERKLQRIQEELGSIFGTDSPSETTHGRVKIEGGHVTSSSPELPVSAMESDVQKESWTTPSPANENSTSTTVSSFGNSDEILEKVQRKTFSETAAVQQLIKNYVSAIRCKFRHGSECIRKIKSRLTAAAQRQELQGIYRCYARLPRALHRTDLAELTRIMKQLEKFNLDLKKLS